MYLPINTSFVPVYSVRDGFTYVVWHRKRQQLARELVQRFGSSQQHVRLAVAMVGTNQPAVSPSSTTTRIRYDPHLAAGALSRAPASCPPANRRPRLELGRWRLSRGGRRRSGSCTRPRAGPARTRTPRGSGGPLRSPVARLAARAPPRASTPVAVGRLQPPARA